MNRSRQLASASQQGGVHDPTPWLVPPVLVRWLGPGVITAAGLVMLCWTWATWPHPLVDFGRELYVPWQLAQGKVLYTEIAWFNGPLSQYWNSVCFRLFGASLRTLVICNLAALALLIALLHHILLRVGGRFSAAGGCLSGAGCDRRVRRGRPAAVGSPASNTMGRRTSSAAADHADLRRRVNPSCRCRRADPGRDRVAS
jgi:hypothetical protein